MRKIPQTLVNVPVPDRDAAMASPTLTDASASAAQELEGRGRVLVRSSGTEQLVRVMVEAPTDDEAHAICARLVSIVQSGD
jgi:phosphoglucosamine mutase